MKKSHRVGGVKALIQLSAVHVLKIFHAHGCLLWLNEEDICLFFTLLFALIDLAVCTFNSKRDKGRDEEKRQ